MKNIDDILSEVEVAPDHPLFYSRLCTFLVKENSQTPKNEEEEIEQICADEFESLSRYLDRTEIQESCSVRNVLKTRRIADKLIGDDGEIRYTALDIFIKAMKKNLYSIAPERNVDAVRDEHILQVLEYLQNNKEIARLLRYMTRPVSNRLAEQVVRDTLLLPTSLPVTDVHVRKACLSAWLCTLRQSLGSCFATAPAIIIQQEQPLAFFRDLDEMMNTGRMKRTYAGIEHSVPVSITWGNGDLRKPLILDAKLSQNENKIWMSPGLLAAMTEVGILKDEMPLGKKTHLLHKRMQESLFLLEQPGDRIVTCAEELIRVLLLAHYELTKNQVEEYLLRPKNMMQSGLVMQVPMGAKFGKAKEDPIPAFLRDFELAKFAFKSLADNPLLKSWEFTLASFSEINLDFCRWNLYSSLGFNADDPGGIGHCLYQLISGKVEQANLNMKAMQEEYEQVAVQMQYIEARFRSASTEKEINWLKMEHQSRQTEMYHIEQLRSDAYDKASKIAGLYEFLMSQYDKLFYNYFQEIYDADLHDVASGPFDDSPAGFRLIYKYGRSNPSQWVRIYSLGEFIEALVSFFTLTEAELHSMPAVKGIENEMSLAITYLVGHVRSDEFIESAFYRMAKAHGVPYVSDPIHNLDKIEKKPWVYTSGGSMSTLVSSYFRREEKPTEVDRWVENETELLAFFIDTVKQLPPETSSKYLKDRNQSMLIHSPTHAFLFKPGFFSQAWTNDLYTYTWIKQQYVEPLVRDIDAIIIDEEIAQNILETLQHSVPKDFRPRFRQVFQRLPYQLSSSGFRTFVVNTIYSDRGLKTGRGSVLSVDEIDSVLYSHLPYTPKNRVQDISIEVLQAVFAHDASLASKVSEVVDETLRRLPYQGVVSAKELLTIIKSICCLIQGNTRSPKDLHKACVDQLRNQKLLLSAPLIFADSNWIKDYFSFVISPATGQIELWSVDFYGVQGRPISYWKMWVNGSKKEPQWGIFNRPYEYIAKN